MFDLTATPQPNKENKPVKPTQENENHLQRTMPDLEWEAETPLPVSRPSWFTKALCVCAGASLHVLEKCPTEYARIAGMGATVCFTAVMAALSGGFAVATFTGKPWIILSFAVLWGLLIFNLDRYLLSSIRKSGNKRKELTMALPRLLLALSVSVVVAKPLETALFSNQIAYVLDQETNQRNLVNRQAKSEELNIDHLTEKEGYLRNRYDSLNRQFTVAAVPPHIEQARQDWKNCQKEIKTKERQIYTFRRQFNSLSQEEQALERATLKALSMGLESKQQACNSLQQSYHQAAADYKQVQQKQLLQAQTALMQHQQKMRQADSLVQDGVVAGSVAAESYGKGFFGQMEALQKLKANNQTMWWAGLAVTLLFVIIESTPVLIKIFSDRGLYDEILQSQEAALRKLYAGPPVVRKRTAEAMATQPQQANTSEPATAISSATHTDTEPKHKMLLPKQNQISLDNLLNKKWHLFGHTSHINYWFEEHNHRRTIVYTQQDEEQKGSWQYEAAKSKLLIALEDVSVWYDVQQLDEQQLTLYDKILGLTLKLYIIDGSIEPPRN